MGSRRSLAALGIGAYLAFVIASFPASVAHRWFAPDGLALASVDGTIWRGSAGFGAAEGVSFSDLRWQFRPIALFSGRIHLSAESRLADGFVRTDLTLSRRRIVFENLTASAGLSTFRAMLPEPDASGQLSLNLSRLELVEGRPVDASGVARVANLVSPPLLPMPGVTLIRLGNFVARLTTTSANGIEAAVSDEGGPLELQGQASLAPDGNYHLEARITPRAEADAALVEGLRFFSQADPSGEYEIELAGRLAF